MYLIYKHYLYYSLVFEKKVYINTFGLFLLWKNVNSKVSTMNLIINIGKKEFV